MTYQGAYPPDDKIANSEVAKLAIPDYCLENRR
jgi:hypothetical protein